jgi:hypothetical protein
MARFDDEIDEDARTIGLQDLIGGVLRDVVKARVQSDEYSRNVAQEYLNDEILKGFPFPKVEIKDLELELKYLIDHSRGGNDLERDIVVLFRTEDLNKNKESISSMKMKLDVKNYMRLEEDDPDDPDDFTQKIVPVPNSD